ncbi:MAG: Hint domain-containing protein [Rhodobacter sp.]|nr:Hint domain-containing protein [Rhodobacter sp.]
MANINVTDDNTTVYVGNNDVIKINITGGGTVTIKADPNDTVDFFKIQFIGDDHTDIAKIDLFTFSQNDLRIDVHHYDTSDEVQLLGAFNKGVDPDNEDEFNFSYIGATGNTFSGYVHAQDGNESDFNADPKPIVICFAEGTVIDTALGPRPVESLREGDLVATQDNGLQPVRWIGSRRLDSIDLARHPELCPIRIATGALGDGKPYLELTVSPQHRVQVADWRADLLFGEPRVLVAAKHIVDGDSVWIDRDVPSVNYYHLLFDRHEVVFANGAATESLHPGDVALDAIGSTARDEVLLLFPGLPAEIASRHTAQRVLRGFEAVAVQAYAC